MAAYAAYRHVELDHVGYGKKRVLKPPGGGSSDIFGVAGGEAQQSPRKVKQYMASNISLTDGAAPMASGPGSTSSAASTASSVETPSPGSPTGSPTRNGTAQTEAQAEQVVEAGQAVAAAGKAPDGEPRGRQFQMESHFSLGYDKATTGPALEREARPGAPAAQEGNPVTGEGYKSAQGATPIRNRVPPGGYSSGLW